jgi:hypothetical protein
MIQPSGGARASTVRYVHGRCGGGNRSEIASLAMPFLSRSSRRNGNSPAGSYVTRTIQRKGKMYPGGGMWNAPRRRDFGRDCESSPQAR